MNQSVKSRRDIAALMPAYRYKAPAAQEANPSNCTYQLIIKDSPQISSASKNSNTSLSKTVFHGYEGLGLFAKTKILAVPFHLMKLGIHRRGRANSVLFFSDKVTKVDFTVQGLQPRDGVFKIPIVPNILAHFSLTLPPVFSSFSTASALAPDVNNPSNQIT